MSHFSAIGIQLEPGQDLGDLADRFAPLARPLEVPGLGTYWHWSDPSGAEMWIQVNEDDELIGMNPHYAGQSVVRVGLTARIPSSTSSELDGSFYGWGAPTSESTDFESTGRYTILFDVPDYRLHDELALPALQMVQIVAFAHDCEVFETVAAFNTRSTEVGRLASQSFIPTGLLTEEEEAADAQPCADAVLAGHVVAAEQKINSLTGIPFYWALVESYEATYDVVIAQDLLATPPAVGGVITGSFWLSGRIISALQR